MLLLMLATISFLPVIFIYVFATGADATMQALAGVIGLTLIFGGLLTAQSVYFNKHWFRFQDIFVASRVSPASYGIGLSFGTLVVSVPTIVLAIAIIIVGHPVSIIGVVLALLVSALLWIGSVFLGFVMGITTKNVRRANTLPQVIAILLGFLPPVYYPLDRLPDVLQPVAMLVPTTHAAQLTKYYFDLLELQPLDLIIGWAYLLGFAAIVAAMAARWSRWVDP